MKNGTAAEPLCVVPEMVKATGEARVGMIPDLGNPIMLEGFIQAKWERNIIVNRSKEKEMHQKSKTIRG